MSWHMSLRYGHGILVSGYPVLTAVNWPYCECPILKSYIKDVDLPRHAWNTPPFLLIVSPTPPVQSVDAYVRTLGQSLDNQTKRGWPYSMSMGLCPTRASRARECGYYCYYYYYYCCYFAVLKLNDSAWLWKLSPAYHPSGGKWPSSHHDILMISMIWTLFRFLVMMCFHAGFLNN